MQDILYFFGALMKYKHEGPEGKPSWKYVYLVNVEERHFWKLEYGINLISENSCAASW